jgi:hypothetical protein
VERFDKSFIAAFFDKMGQAFRLGLSLSFSFPDNE